MDSEMRSGVEELIQKWQQRLGLGNWTIRLSDDKPDEDNRGNSDIWHTKLSVAIRISHSAPNVVWEEIVVHELLHVLLFSLLAGPLDTVLNEYVPAVSQRTIRADVERLEEQTIHRLTVALTERQAQCWDDGDVLSRAFGVV